MTEEVSRCLHCGKVATFGSGDDYYIKDEVWAETGIAPDGGTLCLKCLVKRLVAPLTIQDFPADIPVNRPIHNYYAETGQLPIEETISDPKAVFRAFDQSFDARKGRGTTRPDA